MRISMKWISCCFLIINLSLSYASSAITAGSVTPSPRVSADQADAAWFTKNQDNDVQLNVDLYESSVCPHCQKAGIFFNKLSQSNRWISLHRHVINKDKAALKDFFIRLQHFNSSNFSVPTVIFCNSRWVGFDKDETTGILLTKALDYCREQIMRDGKLSQSTETVLQKWSATGSVDIITPPSSIGFSTVERVVVSAIADAFSPCSLFCFFIFLSFIWMHPEDRKVQFILGMVFILTLGCLHFIELGFYEKYHLLQQYGSWPSAFSGLGLLAYAYYFRKALKVGEPLAWKWAIPVVIASTVMVFVHQQICDLNIGAVFSQWLQAQALTSSAYGFFLLSYTFFYLISMMLLLVFYLVFGVHPRALLSSAGSVLLVIIGASLLFFPAGLSNLLGSCMALLIALVVGWWWRPREQVNI